MKRIITGAMVAASLTLAACGGGSSPVAEEIASNPVLSVPDNPEAIESWWCEAMSEAKALGWSPAVFADQFRDALESGVTNSPATSVEEAVGHLRAVECDEEYARSAADELD